jgi:hypothetical protein
MSEMVGSGRKGWKADARDQRWIARAARRQGRGIFLHRVIPPSIHSFVVARLELAFDSPRRRAMALLCFATRKRNEAWNPGNFGCRGLLVFGLRG